MKTDSFSGINVEEIMDEMINDDLLIRKEPTYQPLSKIPRGLKTFRNPKNKTQRFTTIYGASGDVFIPVEKLKIMTDSLTQTTRNNITMCVYTDPIMSPAIETRHDAFMDNGYDLTFELKSKYTKEGILLTPEESKQILDDSSQEYLKYLQIIRTWDESIGTEKIMREANIASFVQGRTAAWIIPGIADLTSGELPISMSIVDTEDLREPIVDVGLTHKIVAVLVNFPNKRVLRSDEMIYVARRLWGLRKESRFYGSSAFESIIRISQIVKRIYNFNIPQAIVAAYLAKVIFKFNQADKKKMEELLRQYLTAGNVAFAVSSDILEIKPIEIKSNNSLFDMAEKKLADAELGIIKVPKSMLNREAGLTRDIATVQTMQFVKFVQKPDQKLISKEFEDQLYNPLLAHLIGKPFSELPVRIKVIPRLPPKDDTITDKLVDVKKQEVDESDPTKRNASDTSSGIFGASGEDGIVVTPDEDGGYIVRRDNSDS